MVGSKRQGSFWTALLATATVALVAGPALASADVVFSDGEFADADWNLDVSAFDGGQGTTTATAGQQAAGGNLGAFRRINHTLAGAISATDQSQLLDFHRKLDAIYDPGALGEILSVDYSEDAKCLDNSAGSACQAGSAALTQGGKIFGANAFFLTSELDWTPKAQTNLQEDDFSLFSVSSHTLLDFTQHPDFSDSADPVTFGFLRANSTCVGCGIGGLFHDASGIDNWQVTVHNAQPQEIPGPGPETPGVVPEPSSLALLGLGGLALLRRRRQTSV